MDKIFMTLKIITLALHFGNCLHLVRTTYIHTFIIIIYIFKSGKLTFYLKQGRDIMFCMFISREHLIDTR